MAISKGPQFTAATQQPAAAQSVNPNTGTSYNFDQYGNLVPQGKARHPLMGSFAGFYEGRPELKGSNPYAFDWLHHKNPEVDRFNGRDRQKYTAGRGFNGDPETDNSQRATSGEGGYGEKGGEFDQLGLGPRTGYDLTNVRNAPTPGMAVQPWSGSPSTGTGYSWGSNDDAIGSQPALGSGWGGGMVIDTTASD